MLKRQQLITTYRDGVARPYVLKPNSKHLDLSDNLITLFCDSIGRRHFEIEEHIKGFNIEKLNPKVIQGLAELLYKRSAFDDDGAANSMALRSKLFSASATYWKNTTGNYGSALQHRANILKTAAGQSTIPENIKEHQLFGDIASNQALIDFKPITSEQLIHRFNIAQVQGLLLYSRSLELKVHRRISPALKQLMQMMKFFRLMFDLKQINSDWFTLQIDGPAAVLENSRSYGLEIAQFFPAILLLEVPWLLTARLKVPNRRRIFTLEISEDNPYQSHFKKQNVWTHDKTLALLNRFNEKYGPQHHAVTDPEIIPLRDNRYLLPDFTISSKKKTDNEGKGSQMRVEWIHYPSDAKLKWLRQVKAQLPEDYVFAVKGKKDKMKSLMNTMEKHLLLYTKELTAPAIFKKFEKGTG